MEVYVETWLTEEEYKEAKNQQLLAWQDSPKVPMAVDPPETPGDVFVRFTFSTSFRFHYTDCKYRPQDFESPFKNGKNLLWKDFNSTPTTSYFQNSPAPSPMVSLQIQRNPFHQSIASDVGLHFNPFEQQTQGQPIRRLGATRLVFGAVASAPEAPTTPTAAVALPATPSAAGLDESVSSPFDTPVKAKAGVTRSFSKWEKQDLEAEAMKKMREANKRKEGETKSVEKKKVTFDLATPSTSTPPVPATGASTTTSTTTSSIPNFFAKPADKPAQSMPTLSTENKPLTSLFGNPPAAASTSKDAATPKLPVFPASTPSATLALSAPADTAPKQTQSTQLGKGMPSTFNMPQASGSNMAPPPLPTKTQSPFPFNAPASTSNASSAPSNFFAVPPQTQKQPASIAFGGGDQKKPEQTSTQTAGVSLLARMGGFASGPQSDDPKPQQQATSGPASSSFFQNPGPSHPSTSKPQPVFGTTSSAFGGVSSSGTNQSTQLQQASSIAASSNTTTNATSTAPPKFSFGLTSKATPATTSTETTSSLNGALEQPKSTPVNTPTFGFMSKPAESSALTTKPVESNSGNASKFSFGQTSAFSSNIASGSTSKSAAQPSTSSAPKSTFGVSAFGTPSALGSTSAFGTGTKAFGTAGGATAFGGPSAFANPGATGTNVFGGSGATSVFGGAGSGGGAGGASSSTLVFGTTSTATASTEAPKSVFGNTPTTATTAPSTGDEKPKFSFAAPPASSSTTTPASTNAPNFSFKFGPTPSVSGAPAAGQSAFGAAPAAGFGVTPATGQSVFGVAPAAGQSVFGAAPAAGQSVFGAAPAAGQSAFGANPAGQSAFGTKPAASSAFGFTSSATPAAFGFTAPPNTNNNASDSTVEQKQQQQ